MSTRTYTNGYFATRRLDQAEVTRLIARYRGGDIHAGQIIVESHYALVSKIVKTRYQWIWNKEGATHTLEDLTQEGVFGIYDALRKYDGSSAFSTFLVFQIRSRMKGIAEKKEVVKLLESDNQHYLENNFEQNGSIFQVVAATSSRMESVSEWHDSFSVWEDRESNQQLRAWIELGFSELKESDVIILKMRFGFPLTDQTDSCEPMTGDEIAIALKCTRDCATKRISRALERLVECLPKANFDL